VLLFVEPPNHGAVKRALNGLLHVPFHFESSGSRLVLYQPNGL
jgi:D-glycero-alpha-D-manno-heptose-7-phosphate kinase